VSRLFWVKSWVSRLFCMGVSAFCQLFCNIVFVLPILSQSRMQVFDDGIKVFIGESQVSMSVMSFLYLRCRFMMVTEKILNSGL
jgi:hypothetical protein